MSECETYACVTLPWLYKNIEKRTRKATRHEKEKFLAARKIQRYFRDYRSHKRAENWKNVIVQLQSWERGNIARSNYYRVLEDALNKAIIDFYNYAAIIIQKYWRGFIVRWKVHDHRKLRSTQLGAAKDLIVCIAYKLHHLLRTRQIPGVYSIRNSNILSRVEKLLASLKFKEYNDRIRRIRAAKIKKVAEATQESKQSEIKTKVPYSPSCMKLFKENKIKNVYSLLETIDPDRKSQKRKAKASPKAGLRPKEDARDDVVSSMKRWKIVNDEKNLSVSPLIVSKPGNIENFLGEIEAICHQKNLVNDPDAYCVWPQGNHGGVPQGPCNPCGPSAPYDPCGSCNPCGPFRWV